MTNSDFLFDLMITGWLLISWVKHFSISHGSNFIFFSRSLLHLWCIGYEFGLDLWDTSSPTQIWRALRLLTLLSTCNYLNTFFLHFIVITPSHVSYSTLCTLCFIRTFISFDTLAVFFSANSVNSLSSASSFCVSVFLAIMTFKCSGSVLVLEYSGIWWWVEDIYFIWLFLQVESKK